MDEKLYYDTGLASWTKCLDVAFNASAGDGNGDCFSRLYVNSNGTTYWQSAIDDLTDPTGQHAYPVRELEWSNGLA